MTIKTLSVACPNCGKEVIMNATSKYRPFCSERCKLIDLGEWAAERHKIPGKEMEEEVWSHDLNQNDENR